MPHFSTLWYSSRFLEQRGFHGLVRRGERQCYPTLLEGRLTGFSGGEMIRMSSGSNSVMVAPLLNSERKMGCSEATKFRAISSFAIRVW